MNTCILMVKIASEPELRYTKDSQLPLTQMLVEIDGLGPNDPPGTLKAVGWGNLASEIKEKYSQGDQVIVSGRLSIKNFDTPEGSKEKRAELTISHLYPYSSSNIAPKSNINNVVEIDSFKPQATTPITETNPTDYEATVPLENSGQDLDNIPF